LLCVVKLRIYVRATSKEEAVKELNELFGEDYELERIESDILPYIC